MVDSSEIASELIGEHAIPFLEYLKDKEKVSEFKIAKDLELDIHDARRVLYNLYEHGLASFIRRKDKVKGWYVCYWDYESSKLDFLHKRILKTKIEDLKERLKREEGSEFYLCRNACVRMDFDKAVDFEFKCPECSELMNYIDNSRTKEFIEGKIQNLKKELAES